MTKLTSDEYKRLRALDQQALYAHELPADVIKNLGSQPIPDEANQFEHEYKK